VEHGSLWLNVGILVVTMIKVVSRSEVETDPRSIVPNPDEERLGKGHG
jgi:hypothetical protein